jgi:transcriptional regulator with XRE-family HTH domain
MRHLEYDIRLATIIKALRMMRRIKQSVIAAALKIEQPTYCRIEQGEIAITPGQLKDITYALHTSIFEILAIIETEDLIYLKYVLLPEIQVKCVKILKDTANISLITEDELDYIIEKIKHYKVLK